MQSLAETDQYLRRTAADDVIRLDKAALTSHAGAIVNFLANNDQYVRSKVLVALIRLEQAVLTPHAGIIVNFLADIDPGVRRTALDALSMIKDALTTHTVTIISFFTNPDPGVRRTAIDALCKSEKATLNMNVTYVASMLTDTDPGVRRSALILLREVEQATLTAHAGTIASLLTNQYPGTYDGVSYIALCMFTQRDDAFGTLTPAIIQLARSAITNMLDHDTSIIVRTDAQLALQNLKKKLVQFNWTAARAFVDVYRVRPYALFWHEYVGEQLCALGGKWADQDRAAFHIE